MMRLAAFVWHSLNQQGSSMNTTVNSLTSQTVNRTPTPRTGSQKPKHAHHRFTLEQLADAIRISRGIKSEALNYLQTKWGRTLTPKSLNRNIAATPRLQQLQQHVQDIALDYVESAHWKAIEAGDLRAIEFFLRTKGASRGYKLTYQHEVNPTPSVSTPPDFNLDHVPLDDLRAMHAILVDAKQRAAGTVAVSAGSDLL
jgi:uncharacterized protein YbdZ (MbtH family)